VILDRKYRKIRMRNTFDRPVVEITVGDPESRCPGYFVSLSHDCEPVILRSDFHCACV